MRKGLQYVLLFAGICTYGQVGEVTSEEIIIEKDKEIILPKSEKLYGSVESREVERDSIRLIFNIGTPQFNISPFSPEIKPFAYLVAREKLGYQNFFKLGYGSYGSPLVSAFAGDQNKKLNWGAWVHHESFAKGSVRGTESASSTSRADVFATFQNLNWALTPSIGWQNDGYRFYGYSDSDDRTANDKNSMSRFRIGTTLEEIYDNDVTFQVTPTFMSVNQNTPAAAPASAENYFDLNTSGSFRFDSTFSAGADVQFGAISFTSENSINRNFAKIDPWLGIKRKDLFIKVGVEFAMTNDTIISGSKNFFYPNISAEWSGLPGWTVYGKLSGQLRPVTYWSLSQDNLMLDDSLVVAHENVKTEFGGGIRGAITSKLHLNTSVTLSTVENMSFFTPSGSDSARFVITVYPDNITVFKWAGALNWQPVGGTHVDFRAAAYGYSTGALEEAWYKPSFTLGLNWIQKYSYKITSRMSLNSMAGLKAPNPSTGESVFLDAIFDMNVEGAYQINERAEAFIQLQNVFGQEYQQYLNYPTRGIAFKIGGLYRF